MMSALGFTMLLIFSQCNACQQLGNQHGSQTSYPLTFSSGVGIPRCAHAAPLIGALTEQTWCLTQFGLVNVQLKIGFAQYFSSDK